MGSGQERVAVEADIDRNYTLGYRVQASGGNITTCTLTGKRSPAPYWKETPAEANAIQCLSELVFVYCRRRLPFLLLPCTCTSTGGDRLMLYLDSPMSSKLLVLCD